jgi:uncharacterized beta-barrel protein YwiB (DUF1934 family)
MKKCNLSITTVADAQENTIAREGEIEISSESIELFYREENAAVHLVLKGETALIERQGDYSLRLHLIAGQASKGEIGIGGSSGEIETLTYAVQYSVRERSLLLSLKYDLIISGERQRIQLRLLARFNK